MECTVKKTTELTESEQADIVSFFNTIFEKDRTLEQFRNQYLNNPFGYSFHSLLTDEGQIIGCVSYMPSYYIVNRERLPFVNGSDAMVSKPYRDFFNLYDMVITAYDYMRKNGIVYVYGFPNDNAYPVYHKAKINEDIGRLNTYCLPYRIGGVKPQLKELNLLSILFVKIYVFLSSLFAGRKAYHFLIEKEAGTYNVTRYQRLDGDYKRIVLNGSEFVYKIMEYNGIRSAFLIDVFEKSAVQFIRAIKYIIKNHAREFDILLYIGYLPFSFHGLIKMPKIVSPKIFYFCGKILNENRIDRNIAFNINNWDVNLSNYDLL
ncbi:hypothetical protein AGMMS49940_11780 [Spirochaetia bacterium]|nr:hypothetical protein AGMMS49940_11780 [Spirochaetia bacterium]